MWRLKNQLVNTGVYLNKSVEFCDGAIRCTVNELWGNGDRVASGLITSDTKVVFRSQSAMVYLFIQMASEMWMHDKNGDQYFEKAVDGFLKEMFQCWKDSGSAHEVTVVLFTRCFYDAKSLDEFPKRMLDECIQVGYNGAFYEDFYHVIVQNERFEDWMPTISTLRQTFPTYKDYVLNYHKNNESDKPVPKATIAPAAQGNFLEVLNMSLNTFENHYLNRNLDRTGQQSIVITPGVGIFEVDNELQRITKRRIIDSGVGSDLICVGEQPLHAVPLFKLHSLKDKKGKSEYRMPHWINLSFYDPEKPNGYSKYRSRINNPESIDEVVNSLEIRRVKNCRLGCCRVTCSKLRPMIEEGDDKVVLPPGTRDLSLAYPPLMFQEMKEECEEDEEEGYDSDPDKEFQEYDDKVFRQQPKPRLLKPQLSNSNTVMHHSLLTTPQRSAQSTLQRPSKRHLGQRKMSDPEVGAQIDQGINGNQLRSALSGISIPNSAFLGEARTASSYEGSESNPGLVVASSLKTTFNSNNFETSSLKSGDDGEGGSGFEPLDRNLNIDDTFDHEAIKRYLLRPSRILMNPFDPSHTTERVTSSRRRWTHIFPVAGKSLSSFDPDSSRSSISSEILRKIAHGNIYQAQPRSVVRQRKDSENFPNVFNGTDFDPLENFADACSVQTGVDWKSLATPASLPITTDYVPDDRVLLNDYVFNEYEIVPEDILAEATQQRSPIQKTQLGNEEVFMELISQRLAQGFQLILKGKKPLMDDEMGLSTSVSSIGSFSPSTFSPRHPMKKSAVPKLEPAAVYWLSIGTIFHKVTLSADKNQIQIMKYRPKHGSNNLNFHYRYRFQAPDNDTYEVAWVDFRTEKLENFNWNHMDYYVCTRGDKEYLLTENLKYWRYRLYVLPLSTFQPYTKRIMDGSSELCDIYQPEYGFDLMECFMRFIEVCINGLRRNVRSNQTSVKARSVQPEMAKKAFRERAATSMSGAERTKSRGPLKRVRHESGGASPGTPNSDILHCPSVHSLDHHQGSHGGSSGSFESPCPIAHDGCDGHGNNDSDQMSLNIATSTFNDMIDAMKMPYPKGLNFFTKVHGLPPFTFVAFESVMWLKEKVDGITTYSKAIEVLHALLEKRLICHSSGEVNHPFTNGFYLFSITQHVDSFIANAPYRGDLETFKNDWMEVRIRGEKMDSNFGEGLLSVPEFLKDDMNDFAAREKLRKNMIINERFYKSATFDVEATRKSDRKEWCHLKYQHQYEPDSAYELALQWSVASGALVGKMVLNWARKACQMGLSLIPVPHDPFALPITLNSDPVRGPIFIQLDTDCLLDDNVILFNSFDPNSWEQRMFLFREEIAKRFGFVVTCIADRQQSSDSFSTDHQYIHCTGNMFLLIPIKLQLQTGIQGIKLRPSSAGIDLAVSRERSGRKKQDSETSVNTDTDDKPVKSVTRHISETKPTYDHSETGFLWSWNFTISKRWKQVSNTGATGDIKYMDKMLADFRDFCANKDNRLKNFWEECWAKKRANDAARS